MLMAVLGALCNMDLRYSLSWRLGALTVCVSRKYPIKGIHSLDSDMVSRLSMLGRNFSIQFGHTMVECPSSKNPQKIGVSQFHAHVQYCPSFRSVWRQQSSYHTLFQENYIICYV